MQAVEQIVKIWGNPEIMEMKGRLAGHLLRQRETLTIPLTTVDGLVVPALVLGMVLGVLAAFRSLPQRLRRVALVGLGLEIVLLPLIAGESQLRALTIVLIAATVAQGWNFIGGFAGYAAFGNAGYFGLGAYTTAVLMGPQFGWNFPLADIGAALVPAAFAVLIGWPILRLRGHYFAIATLAVGIATGEVVTNLDSLKAVALHNWPGQAGIIQRFPDTGGGSGLSLPLQPVWHIAGYGAFDSNVAYYYSGVIILAIAVAVTALIARRKFGYGLQAIRENEEAAAVMGINTTLYKVIAYSLSAACAGAAGGLSAWTLYTIDPPSSFDPSRNLEMIIMTLLGGTGTVLGPLIGAFALRGIEEYLESNASLQESHLVFLGFTIVIVVLFMRRGIVIALEDGLTAWRRRKNFKGEANRPPGPASTGPGVATRDEVKP